MATSKNPPKKFRDAGTGHYVTPAYAAKHPKTTVAETAKPAPKAKPKGKK